MRSKATEKENEKSGGPAFPFEFHEGMSLRQHYGITLRQYYAGLAMQGKAMAWPHLEPCDIATDAVKCADALIAELQKDG